MRNHRYREFVDALDMEAVYAALDWEPIESKGSEDRGYCFDLWGQHKNGDTTGKLHINREKKVYNCWVCGGGSLLSLVIEKEKLDPESAVDWLRQYTADREKSDDEFLTDIEQALAKLTRHRDHKVLPYFNERVLDQWAMAELDGTGSTLLATAGTEWLKQRGILLHTAALFRIGFDPAAIKHAPRNRAGFAIGDTYTGPAIVLPHFWDGRLVGWQQRWIDDDRPKWVPKYVNTPDFPKNETLFFASSPRVTVPLTTVRPTVVVESVPTALRVWQAGWSVVATFGAHATDEQRKLLRKYPELILAPDNDSPGVEGMIELVDYLEDFSTLSYVEPVGEPGADLGDVTEDEEIVDRILSAERIF